MSRWSFAPPISRSACAGPPSATNSASSATSMGADGRRGRGRNERIRGSTIGAGRAYMGQGQRWTSDIRRPIGQLPVRAAGHCFWSTGGVDRAALAAAPARSAVTDAPFGQSPAQRMASLAAIPGGFQDTPRVLRTDGCPTRSASSPTARCSSPKSAAPAAVREPRRRDAGAKVVVRTATHDFWDRGLIGLGDGTSRSPRGPTRTSPTPTTPATAGRTRARRRPGRPTSGCEIEGRISRVNVNTGQETVLVEDFLPAFPSATGSAARVRGRRGAVRQRGRRRKINYADERPTAGRPDNPCGDPPHKGGSIRSQNIRTGRRPARARRHGPAARPERSAPGSRARAADRRPPGLRNPFRLTIRPGTSEVWAADVDWNTLEEINRVHSRRRAPGNFGWPCYEGAE